MVEPKIAKASFKIDRTLWRAFIQKAKFTLNSDASKLIRKFLEDTVRGDP